jgi:hypothetical protein
LDSGKVSGKNEKKKLVLELSKSISCVWVCIKHSHPDAKGIPESPQREIIYFGYTYRCFWRAMAVVMLHSDGGTENENNKSLRRMKNTERDIEKKRTAVEKNSTERKIEREKERKKVCVTKGVSGKSLAPTIILCEPLRDT